jgi:hypothetical protein
MDKVPKETPYFIAAVKARFSFLSNYDFHLSEIKGSTIRFESPKVYVVLSYEWYTFEINISIGLASRRDSFTFSEITQAIMPGYKYSTGKIASNHESIDAILGEIANFIQNHGRSVISGDINAFDALKKICLATQRKSELQHSLSTIRKNAEKFWRQKDYEEVKKLYGSIKTGLTDVEQKRLKYVTQISRMKAKGGSENDERGRGMLGDGP